MTNVEIHDWPRAAPPPLTQALLRAAPEDFVVEEQLDHVPCGEGEHLWLRLRKRGHNTEQVAQFLARAAGVGRRELSYAGLKDRHAVSVQWFSLHLPGRADPEWRGLPAGVEILEARRHTRKLRTGAHRGNCFTLVLRDCRGDAAALRARLEAIRAEGVPNYFGEQRFGRDADNLARARAMFAGTETVREAASGPSVARGPRLGPIGDRHRRGLYLSAARSYLFNEALAERIRDGSWQALLEGEACVLEGSHSFFVAESIDGTLRTRLAAHDIHPSGPLWGEGELPTRGAVRALELSVIARHADLARGLEAAGLRQERRALRVIPANITAELLDETTWRLGFCLPAGCFATSVVRELADYRPAA